MAKKLKEILQIRHTLEFKYDAKLQTAFQCVKFPIFIQLWPAGQLLTRNFFYSFEGRFSQINATGHRKVENCSIRKWK